MTDTTTRPQNTQSNGEPHLANVKGEPLREATAVLSGTPKRGGPNTAAGKKAVSQNAITHGITSLSPVAGGEDATEWVEFKKGWHDYFQPIGVPEEEIVDFLAITYWRRRRIIRREVALIDARHEAIDDAVQFNTDSYLETKGEQGLDTAGCDVAAGVALLKVLDTLDAETKLDPEAVRSALGVLYFCGPLDWKELPEDEDASWSATAGSFREWISLHAEAEETNYEVWVPRTSSGSSDLGLSPVWR